MGIGRANNRKLYTLREARRFLYVAGKVPQGTTKEELRQLFEQLGAPFQWNTKLGARVVDERYLRDEFPDVKHEPGVAVAYGRPGGDPPPCVACGGGTRRGELSGNRPNDGLRRTYAPRAQIASEAICYLCGRVGVDVAAGSGAYVAPQPYAAREPEHAAASAAACGLTPYGGLLPSRG